MKATRARAPARVYPGRGRADRSPGAGGRRRGDRAGRSGRWQAAGIADATIRIGHVGLILEILGHAGLPRSASSALVEMLSAAAADGKGIQTIESALDRLAGWLKSGGEAEAIVPAVSHADDGGVDRLFRHLVPDVTGRRSGHEIINRLRRKWDLDHSLSQILGRVRDQFHGLAELRGPAPGRARAARTRVSPRWRRDRSPTWGPWSSSSVSTAWSRVGSSSTWVSAAESAFTRR